MVRHILELAQAWGWDFLTYAIPLVTAFYGHDFYEWVQTKWAWLQARDVKLKFGLGLVVGFVAMKLAGAGGAVITGDPSGWLESDTTAVLTGLAMVLLKLSRGQKALTARTADPGA